MTTYEYGRTADSYFILICLCCRFSDFLVNEITLSDEVVQLTDLSVPPDDDPEAVSIPV